MKAARAKVVMIKDPMERRIVHFSAGMASCPMPQMDCEGVLFLVPLAGDDKLQTFDDVEFHQRHLNRSVAAGWFVPAF